MLFRNNKKCKLSVISSSYGNCDVEKTSRNCAIILDAFKAVDPEHDILFFKGAAHNLLDQYLVEAPYFHGSDGLMEVYVDVPLD
mmetsp:Transcript_85094/g.183470  ORF Transcript_85094/g.183470 Transcript_85094/m.183470 type:complete len:84 (+) Transcript_85094:99-350(+)